MNRPTYARSKPASEPQPGQRICDRCGIEHGSRDHPICGDCREVVNDGPNWMRRKERKSRGKK